MSIIFKGQTVNNQKVIGRLHIITRITNKIEHHYAISKEKEMERLERAKGKAKEAYQRLCEQAVRENQLEAASLFEVYQVLIDSGEFNKKVRKRIQEGNCAQRALEETGAEYYHLFEAMDDDYMKERGADLLAVSNKIIDCLSCQPELLEKVTEPVILVAEEILAEDLLRIKRENILGFVSEKGTLNSHVAILARMMNIPALVNTDITLTNIKNGAAGIINGEKGIFIVEPEQELIHEYRDAMLQMEMDNATMIYQKGKESITKDGRKVLVCANISSDADLAQVLENDADGIGLFRTEFLYIGRENPPDEEEQFQIYKTVLESLGNKPVMVRTFDLGADKKVDYMPAEGENPALGCRSLRLYFKYPEIFKTQLRALYRASVYGNLKIVYPLIISVEEYEKILSISMEVQKELSCQGIKWKQVLQGIMIETPAAALVSDELAKKADFFNIGTNDLTQYTLAIDRENTDLSNYYNPYHKGIIRLMQMAIDNIHKEGKEVGICGELGADVDFTETLVKMGIDEISVVPSMILNIRKIIREV